MLMDENGGQRRLAAVAQTLKGGAIVCLRAVRADQIKAVIVDRVFQLPCDEDCVLSLPVWVGEEAALGERYARTVFQDRRGMGR